MPAKIALAIVFLTLCGFRFSLMFGELSWEKIDAVLQDDFSDVTNMEIRELADRMSKGEKLYLLDVRSREEYLVSHIPGAQLAEEFNLASRSEDVLIVAYCSVGLRSAEYVQKKQKEGTEKIYNLRGSIFMWANRGLVVVADQGPVEEVHPYNSRWGKLLDKRLHSR